MHVINYKVNHYCTNSSCSTWHEPPKILATAVLVLGRCDPWRNPRKLGIRPARLELAVAEAFVPTVLSNFRTPAHPQTTSPPKWGKVTSPFCWNNDLLRKPTPTTSAPCLSSFHHIRSGACVENWTVRLLVRTGNVSFWRYWNPCWRMNCCCYRNAHSGC
jgi:hypothetical protein